MVADIARRSQDVTAQSFQALLRDFNKISSTPDLLILQDLPQQESRLKSCKPPLRLASQLKAETFNPNTNWVNSWDVFDGRNSFLVSEAKKSVDGMIFLVRDGFY
uniref:Uncharacterized protein n=1 Tax=Graphocephala atropunctata TaxID=36148 RepID=A0A1B6LNX6_9HEMI